MAPASPTASPRGGTMQPITRDLNGDVEELRNILIGSFFVDSAIVLFSFEERQRMGGPSTFLPRVTSEYVAYSGRSVSVDVRM